MKAIALLKNKWLVLIVAIIYRYYLDLSYSMLSENYPIEFPLRTNIYKLLLSYFVVCLLVLITYKKNLITSYLFRILTFFTMIPLTSIYSMKDESSAFFFLTFFSYYAVQLLFIQRHHGGQESDVSFSDLRSVNFLRYSCLILMIITVILMYVQLGNPSLEALILENVYEIRQNLNISSYTRYMLFVCAQVIVPFGIAEGFVRKSGSQVLLCIFFQLLFFLWTGNKTWFFSIFLLFAIMLLLITKRNLDYFFLGLTMLCAIGYHAKDDLISQQVGSLLNRRVLLDPAALKFSYYDYFVIKGHERIYFSATVLGPVFRGTLGSTDDYTFNISSNYTDKASNAVTGIYGGDLANWGLLAFILVPVSLYFFADLAEKSKFRIGSNFTYLFLTYLFFLFDDHRIVSYILDFQGLVFIFILYQMSKKQLKTRNKIRFVEMQ